MLLKLTKSATVELVVGEQLQTQPGFLLNGLQLYCGLDQADMIGSSPRGWSSADTFWLDRNTLKLVSVGWGIPEVLPEAEEIAKLSLWQEVPWQAGIVRLLQWYPFEVEVADLRWMDEEGKALLCPLYRAFEDAQERVRVRIASDLELWFADGEYCGWSLLNPASYLIEEPGDELTLQPEPVDREIISLLSDYLLIVTKDNSVLMDDGDPDLRARHLQLYERARAVHGQEPQRRILRLAIADILDRFYNLQVSE